MKKAMIFMKDNILKIREKVMEDMSREMEAIMRVSLRMMSLKDKGSKFL